MLHKVITITHWPKIIVVYVKSGTAGSCLQGWFRAHGLRLHRHSIRAHFWPPVSIHSSRYHSISVTTDHALYGIMCSSRRDVILLNDKADASRMRCETCHQLHADWSSTHNWISHVPVRCRWPVSSQITLCTRQNQYDEPWSWSQSIELKAKEYSTFMWEAKSVRLSAFVEIQNSSLL